MKNNDVDSFDINDGKQILYTQNKVKSAFTRKNLNTLINGESNHEIQKTR